MYRFFEVFKTLKLPEDLAVYFENVEVTKVSKTSTNSLARVYIKSDRVIEKPIIFKVEDALGAVQGTNQVTFNLSNT